MIGKPEQLGERTWRWPQILPGGENVLFTGAVAVADAAIDSRNIEILSLRSGQAKIVQRGGHFGRYLPSGHLVYIRQATLYGVRFDLGRLETRGAPAPLIEDVAESSRFSFSRPGVLLYASAAKQVAPVAWLDSNGKQVPIPALNISQQAETPRLSPDGNRLALSVAGDLFVHDLQRGMATRLTFDAALNRRPVWTPDGQHIIYVTPRMCPHATANSESGGFAVTVRARLRSCSPRELLFKRFRFPRTGPWQLFALARIGVLRLGCSRWIGTIRSIPKRARPSL